MLFMKNVPNSPHCPCILSFSLVVHLQYRKNIFHYTLNLWQTLEKAEGRRAWEVNDLPSLRIARSIYRVSWIVPVIVDHDFHGYPWISMDGFHSSSWVPVEELTLHESGYFFTGKIEFLNMSMCSHPSYSQNSSLSSIACSQKKFFSLNLSWLIYRWSILTTIRTRT